MKLNAKHTLLAGAVLLAVTAFGCATTRPIDDQFDDAVITSKVNGKITADPTLNPFEIDVDTSNRVVTLIGTVETARDREHAERIARDTQGVSDVRNEIQLGDPTFKENVTDNWILTKIKTKLTADPVVNPFNIDVDVVRGSVTLSGTVAKKAARIEAEEHARNTKGVKRVDNRIKIEKS